MESVEIKRRHGGVTPEKPVKITDLSATTGDCDVKVANGSVIIWKGFGYTLDGKQFDKYEQQLEVIFYINTISISTNHYFSIHFRKWLSANMLSWKVTGDYKRSVSQFFNTRLI